MKSECDSWVLSTGIGADEACSKWPSLAKSEDSVWERTGSMQILKPQKSFFLETRNVGPKKRQEPPTYLVQLFPLNCQKSGSKSLTLQLNNAKGAGNGISCHTPVASFYCFHSVFAESPLCAQPMYNSLTFEHTSFLTGPDSQCSERSLMSRIEPFHLCSPGFQPRACQRGCIQLILVERIDG